METELTNDGTDRRGEGGGELMVQQVQAFCAQGYCGTAYFE